MIDQKKLGLDITAYIQVNLERHSDELVAQFESAVLREPEVVACYVMSGAFDFLLKVVTSDLEAYADFAMRRLLKVPGVKDISSSFVLEMVKAPGRLPLERLQAWRGRKTPPDPDTAHRSPSVLASRRPRLPVHRPIAA